MGFQVSTALSGNSNHDFIAFVSCFVLSCPVLLCVGALVLTVQLTGSQSSRLRDTPPERLSQPFVSGLGLKFRVQLEA